MNGERGSALLESVAALGVAAVAAGGLGAATLSATAIAAEAVGQHASLAAVEAAVASLRADPCGIDRACGGSRGASELECTVARGSSSRPNDTGVYLSTFDVTVRRLPEGAPLEETVAVSHGACNAADIPEN